MAARSASIIRRSLLYVPGSSRKMLDKSLCLSSDNVTYDLEDSVTPSQKPNARSQLASFLASHKRRPSGISELAVRINAVSTPFAEDDLTTIAPNPLVDAVVVPKVESAADLTFVTDVLKHDSPQRHAGDSPNPIKIVALIESAKAIMDLPAICRATPQLSGLIFAAEDFALDLSITRTPSLREFLYARSAIVTAARAFGLPSAIDLVCTEYKGEGATEKLEAECLDGKNLGFNGKQCIHPSQLELVQRAFAPSPAEIDWAIRVIIANEKAAASGRGAWTLDGKMIDAPVVGKALSLEARAKTCGIDVHHLREKWRHEEPQ